MGIRSTSTKCDIMENHERCGMGNFGRRAGRMDTLLSILLNCKLHITTSNDNRVIQ